MSVDFTPQFVEKFLNPLVKQIMTDMASPTPENAYLQRLTLGLQSQKFQPLEREKFFQTYFRTDKTKPFSTTEKDDVDFQNEFLDEFTKSFDMHKGLSGVDGVKKLYFPVGEQDKEKEFSSEAERNVYRLAYKLSQTFEKKRLEELMKKEKGVLTDKDKENIETGKVKLIFVDGVARYITEDEAKVAAQNPATKGLKVQTFTGEEKTLGDLGSDSGFTEAKAASMEMALEQNGLEVVEPLQPDPANPKKFAKGVVKDASGQKLDVKVDMDADPKDAKKFTFTFQDSPPGKANHKGESFTSSLADLKRFEPTPGDRKTAEEVSKQQAPDVAKEKQGAEAPPLYQPGQGGLVPGAPLGQGGGDITLGVKSPKDVSLGIKRKGQPLVPKIGEGGAVVPGVPGGSLLPGVVVKPGQGSSVGVDVNVPKGSLIGPQPTIMEKKKAVIDEKEQQPGAVLPPASPFLGNPTGEGQGGGLGGGGEKKSKFGRWMVAAQAGTLGGLIGGSTWAAIASNGDADAAKKVVVMVLKTIGLA